MRSATLIVLGVLLWVSAQAAPAGDDRPQALCARWAAADRYPNGIEQERCRSAFPDLATGYGAYCERVKGSADALTRAACLSYKDERRRG